MQSAVQYDFDLDPLPPAPPLQSRSTSKSVLLQCPSKKIETTAILIHSEVLPNLPTALSSLWFLYEPKNMFLDFSFRVFLGPASSSSSCSFLSTLVDSNFQFLVYGEIQKWASKSTRTIQPTWSRPVVLMLPNSLSITFSKGRTGSRCLPRSKWLLTSALRDSATTSPPRPQVRNVPCTFFYLPSRAWLSSCCFFVNIHSMWFKIAFLDQFRSTFIILEFNLKWATTCSYYPFSSPSSMLWCIATNKNVASGPPRLFLILLLACSYI